MSGEQCLVIARKVGEKRCAVVASRKLDMVEKMAKKKDHPNVVTLLFSGRGMGRLVDSLFDELFVVDTGVESNEKSFERYSVQIFNKLLILFLKARFTVLPWRIRRLMSLCIADNSTSWERTQ